MSAIALSDWASEARAVHQIALSLSQTSFAPRTMQGRPEEITGAILAGRELGLTPMAALRSVDIIDGTPALRALAMRGLVQAQGHEVHVVESTETRAVVRGRRKGEAQVQTSTWTLDRARKANLAGKKNWQTHPGAMLIARATAEVCRLIAADVLIAMPYAAEEIGDEEMGTAAVEAAEAPRRRPLARRPLADDQPAPAPPLVAEFTQSRTGTQPGPSIDDYKPPPMLAATRAGLLAAWSRKGFTRPARLAHASAVLGRQVDTSSDLDEAEAQAILADLLAREPREQQQEEGEEGAGDGGQQ